MHPRIVCGIVTRDAPVSHWSIFSLSRVTVTDVLTQFLSRFLSVEFIKQTADLWRESGHGNVWEPKSVTLTVLQSPSEVVDSYKA